ncbi:MAG: hypothetical protein IT480_05110 [Gammaproteobacteria bacterium]|nr:hypothetical protein [Gammaproteobacteria bacterium]
MARLHCNPAGWLASAALVIAGAVCATEPAASSDGTAAPDTAKPALAANRPQEARIAFANEGGIRDWQADGERGIWVQDNHRRWYYGRFMSACTGLQFVHAVRFKTGAAGELDRFGAVRARDTGNCTFTSFTVSEGPPRKDRKGAGKGTAPTPAPTAPAPPGG